MKNTLNCTAVFVALTVLSIGAFAQTNAQKPPQETTPAPSLPSPPAVIVPAFLPIVNPANELKGSALLEALRKGGFVLYMRHAETGVVTEKCSQSNLTAAGEEQARKVGAALREL